MEMKSSITDTWRLFGLGSLVGWLILLLFLQQNNYNMNLLAIRNVIGPFNISISSIDVPNFRGKQLHIEKKCNIFDGRWVYKPEESPTYDPLKCPFVEEKMSCKKNGRPDLAYEHWQWEARDCSIPLLNGTDMVERLRNKRVILVGDSLNRNMWESLACTLYSSIPLTRAVVKDNSSIPVITLTAKDYNFTVEFYWSPFLVDFNLNHKSGKKVLVLDKLSPNSKHWPGADIMVFNSGHWWAQTGTYKRYELLEYDGKLIEDMELELAYEKGMRTWQTWVEENVDPKKTTVFFRSISTEHKSSKLDQWCYKKTQPIKDESYISYYPNSLVEIIEKVIKEKRKTQVKYLNITKLSEYRIDAHPSMYRYKDWKNLTKVYKDVLPAHADCSHWCLPGVPDTWNRDTNLEDSSYKFVELRVCWYWGADLKDPSCKFVNLNGQSSFIIFTTIHQWRFVKNNAKTFKIIQEQFRSDAISLGVFNTTCIENLDLLRDDCKYRMTIIII